MRISNWSSDVCSSDLSVVAATPSIVSVTCSLPGSPCLVLLAICETCDPECRTRPPGCSRSTDGPVTKVGRTAWSGPVPPFGPGWPERRSTQLEARRPLAARHDRDRRAHQLAARELSGQRRIVPADDDPPSVGGGGEGHDGRRAGVPVMDDRQIGRASCRARGCQYG